MGNVYKGVDFTTPLTTERAKALVSAGYTFVCRYLVPASESWKRLTADEAKIASDAGLYIISVFETAANRASGGAANGKPDGISAYKEALSVGQPRGSAIYFAVDYDAQSSDYDAIERYLRAAAAQIDPSAASPSDVGYEIGVYGSYDVVEEMVRRGAVKHGWQTYAWSSGRKSTQANVYQHQNGVNVCGVLSDLNESYGNEGAWTLNAKQSFIDVNPNAWYADAIKTVKDNGLMSGYPDGTFKPNDPVTRAELASVLATLLSHGISVKLDA